MASDEHNDDDKKISTGELISSAKLLAGMAFGGGTEKPDKAQIAEAAGNLLEGANQYGKLDEKGYGKYIDQAESYLNKIAGTHSKPEKSKDEDHDDSRKATKGTKKPNSKSAPHDDDDDDRFEDAEDGKMSRPSKPLPPCDDPSGYEEDDDDSKKMSRPSKLKSRDDDDDDSRKM